MLKVVLCLLLLFTVACDSQASGVQESVVVTEAPTESNQLTLTDDTADYSNDTVNVSESLQENLTIMQDLIAITNTKLPISSGDIEYLKNQSITLNEILRSIEKDDMANLASDVALMLSREPASIEYADMKTLFDLLVTSLSYLDTEELTEDDVNVIVEQIDLVSRYLESIEY